METTSLLTLLFALYAEKIKILNQEKKQLGDKSKDGFVFRHDRPDYKTMLEISKSQMDLFDPKEELTKRHGQSYFKQIAGEVEFIDSVGALMRSPYKFRQHGECGMSVSEVMPHLAKQVDDNSCCSSCQGDLLNANTTARGFIP